MNASNLYKMSFQLIAHLFELLKVNGSFFNIPKSSNYFYTLYNCIKFQDVK